MTSIPASPDRMSSTRSAPAKVNAVLAVMDKRSDGYHEIESLLLPLSLADTVTVAITASRARSSDAVNEQVQMVVSCDITGPMAAGVPRDRQNLAARAAAAYLEAGGWNGVVDGEPRLTVTITIVKRIPVAAGLGGGSSDAAAALLALEDISALPLGPERLSEIGAGVGCDVPALLAGGPALVAGRGEQVSAASSPSAPTWWAIRPLDVYVAAADAYAWWDQDGGPTASPRGAAEAVDAFATGDLERLGTLLRNDLQGPVSRRHPEVAETIAAFERAGSLGVIMSGSGPTVVALARDETDARRLAAEVAGADAVSTPVSTVSRPPFTGDAGPEGRFA